MHATATPAPLAEHERKELLRFVVVGSVDDGKSTLIGRLLFEGHGLYEDQIAAVRRASRQAGLELDFSLFTDGLLAEREQGITIDVAYRYFATAKRKYVIADTPGHEQYTRNMATGASTADAAVILLDARLGVLPQSRRHAFIASLLGIPHLAVAVNKMDLVGYRQEAFARVAADFERFAAPLGFRSLTFVPISAAAGDNVVGPSANTPWYGGPDVLAWLEGLPAGRDAAERNLRFPVQLVVRPHLDYRGFAGQLASGRVRVGDELVALPSGQRSRVKAIDTFDGPLQEAAAPASVTLRLADEIDLSRGDLLAPARSAPTAASELEARLIWLGDRPLDPSAPYLLKHTSRRVRARVAEVLGRVDLETLAEAPAAGLERNDVGRVRVVCQRPIFCDPYPADRATGAFVLIDARSNATVAAGMVVSARAAALAPGAEPVTPAERRRRLGHGGALLRLPPGEPERAVRAERELFELGLAAARAGDPAAARALAGAGLLALYAGPEPLDPAGLPLLEPAPDAPLADQLAAAGLLG